MVDIEFNYYQSVTIIQARLDEPFQDVINRYIQKSLLDPSSVYFFANAKQINPANSVESQMNDLDKINKKMFVQVHLLERDDQDNGQVITNSKDIICPTCKEPCRITFDNFKIKLYICSAVSLETTSRAPYRPFTKRLLSDSGMERIIS